ncbi:hypothetical protein BS17DRAFT_657166, partial [Gyrodon lividus]
KGFLSQNCLFICDFSFSFIYSLCGWDGSIADADFGTCDALLVPYHSVCYHLKEW